MREVYEEQVAAEYGYAELTPHGYYEYIDQPSEDLDDLDDDDNDQGSGGFLGDETDNDKEVDHQYSETNERRETGDSAAGDSAAGDGSDDEEDDNGLFLGADSDAEDDDDDDAEVIDEVFKPGLMSGIRGIRH